ncbi:MAG: hypothetical protein DSY70_05340 [Desulfobulbus sp.]|nr:MAG: hypothetical protein DSY70_05340 [Desulfobulbus sp.]
MKEIVLPPELSQEISEIYQAMQEEYELIAEKVPLTCSGCPDNCCDSYFQHHTYSEWAYLWEGLRQLDDETLDRVTEQAKEYVQQSKAALKAGKRPQITCPLLNLEEGLCALYQHRMLVCRMHGVPATLIRPDGQHMRFPGCFRCQEIVEENFPQETDAPAMDRTLLFRRLAALESRLMGERRHLYPRVKKTIADMIVEGPPTTATPHCER